MKNSTKFRIGFFTILTLMVLIFGTFLVISNPELKKYCQIHDCSGGTPGNIVNPGKGIGLNAPKSHFVVNPSEAVGIGGLFHQEVTLCNDEPQHLYYYTDFFFNDELSEVTFEEVTKKNVEIAHEELDLANCDTVLEINGSTSITSCPLYTENYTTVSKSYNNIFLDKENFIFSEENSNFLKSGLYFKPMECKDYLLTYKTDAVDGKWDLRVWASETDDWSCVNDDSCVLDYLLDPTFNLTDALDFYGFNGGTNISNGSQATEIVTTNTETFSGIINEALYSDGTTGDNLIREDTGYFHGSFNISACFWFNPNNTASGQMISNPAHETGCSGNGLAFKFGSANNITVEQRTSGGGADVFNTNSTLTAGRFYHMCWTYDGSDARVYLNSTIISFSALPEGSIDSESACGPEDFGMNRHDNTVANVTFDAYGIWNFTLSQDQVDTMYNSGLGLEAPFEINALPNTTNPIVLTADPLLTVTNLSVNSSFTDDSTRLNVTMSVIIVEPIDSNESRSLSTLDLLNNTEGQFNFTDDSAWSHFDSITFQANVTDGSAATAFANSSTVTIANTNFTMVLDAPTLDASVAVNVTFNFTLSDDDFDNVTCTWDNNGTESVIAQVNDSLGVRTVMADGDIALYSFTLNCSELDHNSLDHLGTYISETVNLTLDTNVVPIVITPIVLTSETLLTVTNLSVNSSFVDDSVRLNLTMTAIVVEPIDSNESRTLSTLDILNDTNVAFNFTDVWSHFDVVTFQANVSDFNNATDFENSSSVTIANSNFTMILGAPLVDISTKTNITFNFTLSDDDLDNITCTWNHNESTVAISQINSTLGVRTTMDDGDEVVYAFSLNCSEIDHDGLDHLGTSQSQTINLTLNTNDAPLVNVTRPVTSSELRGVTVINWTVTDPDNHNYSSNVSVNNGTKTAIISDLPDGFFNASWNTASFPDGLYNVTVEVCDNITVDVLCGSNQTEVTIDNTLPVLENLSVQFDPVPTSTFNSINLTVIDVNNVSLTGILMEMDEDGILTNVTAQFRESVSGSVHLVQANVSFELGGTKKIRWYVNDTFGNLQFLNTNQSFEVTGSGGGSPGGGGGAATRSSIVLPPTEFVVNLTVNETSLPGVPELGFANELVASIPSQPIGGLVFGLLPGLYVVKDGFAVGVRIVVLAGYLLLATVIIGVAFAMFVPERRKV